MRPRNKILEWGRLRANFVWNVADIRVHCPCRYICYPFVLKSLDFYIPTLSRIFVPISKASQRVAINTDEKRLAVLWANHEDGILVMEELADQAILLSAAKRCCRDWQPS